MSKPKPVIVVSGASDRDAVPGLANVATAADYRFANDAEELAHAIEGADVLFGWDFRCANLKEVWHRANNLSWIQWSGAGVDALLFDDLVASKVVLTNVRGVFDRAMAEFCLGQILIMCKDFATSINHKRDGVWEHRLSHTVLDRKVLVVGAGSIGREIARLLTKVGMRVSGVGTYERDGDADFKHVYAVDELLTYLGDFDYVVLVTPLTPRTRSLFGPAEFKAMHPGARFINLGRGALVNEDALEQALRTGEVASAALDVFEAEPLPKSSALWSLDNCLITPHMSGDFYGYEAAVTAVFGDNLERYVAGEPLENVVDKAAGYVAK